MEGWPLDVVVWFVFVFLVIMVGVEGVVVVVCHF